MKHLLLIALLLLAGTAHAQSLGGAMLANPVGNLGDPYRGRLLGCRAAVHTNIVACGATLLANTQYCITTPLNCGAGTVGLSVNGPDTVLDGGGFPYIGRIEGLHMNLNGVKGFNFGAHTCAWVDSGNQLGCWNFLDDGFTPVADFEFWNIGPITNTGGGGVTDAVRNFYVEHDYNAASSAFGLKTHNLTGTLTGDHSQSARTVAGVQFTSGGKIPWEAWLNSIHIGHLEAGSQGLASFFGGTTNFHDNAGTADASDVNGCCDTARLLLFDGTVGYIGNNTLSVANNRGIRVRGALATAGAVLVNDNTLLNVSNQGTAGATDAVHIGDPDSGSDTMNALFTGNPCQQVAGHESTCYFVRDATGVTIQLSPVTCIGGSCSAGTFARVQSLSTNTTTVCVKNNTVTALPAPQSLVDGAVATLHLQASGTGSASGGGTLDGTCP